jgi:photosystem II PsbY protein
MVRVALGLVLILAIVGYSAFSVITTGQGARH